MKKYNEALVKNDMDRLMFADVAESSPVICEMANDVAKEGISDVFSSLYKLEPEIKEDAGSTERRLMEQMMNMPEWSGLREYTALNDISSALATVDMGKNLMQEYEKIQKAQEARQKQQKGQQGDQGQQGMPMPGGGDQEADGDGQGQPQPGQGSGGQETLEELLGEEGAAQMRSRLRSALGKAQEQAEELDEAMGAWGSNDEEIQNMNFRERLALAQDLTQNPKFKKISSLMGRFKNFANAELATTFSHGQDEIYDIGVGNSLSHLLPTELMKLKTNPVLFYKDYLDQSLLQYNLKGVEPQGKGPMIVCMDCSGSMANARIEWAAAVTMALCHIAEKQGRKFAFMAFNNNVKRVIQSSEGQKLPMNKKMQIISTDCSGGTDFQQPLRKAMEIRREDRQMEKADIVFITDGECEIGPQFKQQLDTFRAETNTRIYGIAIHTSGGALRDIADSVAFVTAGGDIDELKGIFSKTAKGD